MNDLHIAPELHSSSFRCMTTEIELFLRTEQAGVAAGALAAVEQFFFDVEARLSRFRDDSELTRLNRSAGRPAPVSPELYELVERAIAAARASQGIFDPTVIDALEAAGYDRSIEEIRSRGTQVRAPADARAVSQGRWRSIEVNSKMRTVTLPERVRLDLGGIAKGWAVDRAAAMLKSFGPGLVNAGGDLRAWGDQPGAEAGQGWLTAVDDPASPGSDVVWLWAREGALATSTTAARRWAGGHHLVDPRTGRPAETDLVSVSATAATAAQAEIAAKVVLILGTTAGRAWLVRQRGVEALLVTTDGQVIQTPGLAKDLAWSRSATVVH